MADTFSLELITWANITDQNPFWKQFKLVKDLILGGKKPQVLHTEIVIDTSQADAPSEETTDPAKNIIDFTTAGQAYIRSSAAGDTSKDIDVIGQKGDGSFGQFTLTSDPDDGTTAVDVGTWYWIGFAIKNDAWAGNCIIDDDGLSTNVYITAALGATSTLGTLAIPKDFHGVNFAITTRKTKVPAAGDGLFVELGDLYKGLIELYGEVKDRCEGCLKHYHTAERIDLKTFFTANVITAEIDIYTVIWE